MPLKIVLTLLLLVLIVGCIKPREIAQTKQTEEVEKMGKKALFIIAPEGYQDIEYNTPKQILEKGGVQVVTASRKAGVCKGKLGGTAQASLALAEVKAKDYETVVFIGGPGAVTYQQDVQAHRIAQEAVKENKILAAICIAPTILAYAGVLEGRKATVWNGDGEQGDILEEKGAVFTDEEVTVEGKLITANGPGAAEKFGQMILAKLK